MFGTSDSSGPLGLPARKRVLSVAIVIVRGVWHSPQWATARTRYSPRATPEVGADVGGLSRGANAASHAGRNTLSNIGTEIFFGCFACLTGGTERRNATSAFRSSADIPLKTVYGCTGIRRSPLGRRPSRVAVMICSSVQPPIPVSRSGVMLLEYTLPNGPSYLRPPALTDCLGTVWQPHPPVAPNTYLPRASSAADGACADASAGSETRNSRRRAARRQTRRAKRLTIGGRRSSRSRAGCRSRPCRRGLPESSGRDR